jgi:hypothetical protein
MVTVHTIRRNLRFVGVVLVALTAWASVGQASMLDLTTSGSSGSINDAGFLQADVAPAGSGNLDSFVRIKGKDVEEGYNTSWRPVAYDENTSPTFTHSLSLNSVPIVSSSSLAISGLPTGDYYEFILDINQENKHPLLSLDALQIFQLNDAYPHYTTGPYAGDSLKLDDLAAAGTLAYDLGEDNWIALNYSLEAGSGNGDMYAYIPVDNFDGAIPYVFLYSMFGNQGGDYANNDGYEEWAVRGEILPPPPPVVPVPGAVVLGMLGMSVAGWRLRRFA